MVEVRNIWKTYTLKGNEKVEALKDVSFILPKKGLIFITGTSGSGKSTMLNLLGILDNPDNGEIIIDGKNINKLTSSEMDSYRNTHIGFIFQEYNLLDNFKAGKNVRLAMDLQGRKSRKARRALAGMEWAGDGIDSVEQAMAEVGLAGMELRQINQMSGGQKQRLAIARAIVKNPTMIIADEPTGNLDEETSRQIFDILKNISRTRLVVVVTHNKPLAEEYGDRIMELEHGVLKNDTDSSRTEAMAESVEEGAEKALEAKNGGVEAAARGDDEACNDSNHSDHRDDGNDIAGCQEGDGNKSELKLVKTGLPLGKAIGISFGNLRSKKIRLIVMTLLLSVAFTCFAFSYLLRRFDIDKTHVETMIKHGATEIEISKVSEDESLYAGHQALVFSKSEINSLMSDLKGFSPDGKIAYVGEANEDNNKIGPILPSQAPEYRDEYTDIEDSCYYINALLGIDYRYTYLGGSELDRMKLIGKKPEAANEIVIHKYIADIYMKKGVLVSGTDKKGKPIRERYNPTDYEALIKDKKPIIFGSTTVTVCGIIDDDLSKYVPLKTMSQDEADAEHADLVDLFREIERTSCTVYVSSFFDTEIGLKPNNSIDDELYKTKFTLGDKEAYYNGNSNIEGSVKIYDGSRRKNITSLEEGQVLIDWANLEMLYGDKFSQMSKAAEEAAKRDYDARMAAYEKKCAEIDAMISSDEEGSDYEPVYPEEPKPIDMQALFDSTVDKFIREIGVIGTSTKIDITDLYGMSGSEPMSMTSLGEFTIAGVALDGCGITFASDMDLKKYMRQNVEKYAVYYKNADKAALENVLLKYNIEGNGKFISKTKYSDVIITAKEVVKKVAAVAGYASLGALCFAVILFAAFSLISVKENKKSIGVLRALGAKVIDIYKIFYLEVFLMGALSLAVSSVAVYLAVKLANKLIAQKVFADIEPILYRPEVSLVLLGVLVAISVVSFVIPVMKIAKTKPHDVIN